MAEQPSHALVRYSKTSCKCTIAATPKLVDRPHQHPNHVLSGAVVLQLRGAGT